MMRSLRTSVCSFCRPISCMVFSYITACLICWGKVRMEGNWEQEKLFPREPKGMPYTPENWVEGKIKGWNACYKLFNNSIPNPQEYLIKVKQRRIILPNSVRVLFNFCAVVSSMLSSGCTKFTSLCCCSPSGPVTAGLEGPSISWSSTTSWLVLSVEEK